MFDSFSKECKQLYSPSVTDKIQAAFEKANKEWSTELMLAIADWIIKWYDDDVAETATIVTMEHLRIKLDATLCTNVFELDLSKLNL